MKIVRFSLPLIVLILAVTAGIVFGPDLVGRFAYAVELSRNKAARSQLADLSKHDQLSTLFKAVAKVVKPAVVEIRVNKKVTYTEPNLDDFFRRRFGDDRPFGPRLQPRTPEGRKREFFQRGLGSGVIINAEKGYVLTNNHVVADADEVEIVLADKRKFTAEWVRKDARTDLAIVKIKPDRLISAPLGDSDKMDVGDWVLAIGAPRGLAQTVTAGIVSAKGRTSGSRTMYQDYIQTDAAINRGNSGGPLVNMRGQVIGISNSIMSYSGGFEGIGFAIPSNMARNITDQLIRKGKVVRGYLGVRIQNVDGKLAKSFSLPTPKGALISQVADGTPAKKAGMKVGDFIISVNGKETPDVNQLRNVVASVKPGTAVAVVVYRDGKKKTLRVKIEPQPADMVSAFVPRSGGGGGGGGSGGPPARAKKFGLEVTTLTKRLAEAHGYKPSVKGVMVIEVDSDSDAAKNGIRAGVVITHVQGRAVTSSAEFTKALSAKSAASGARMRLVLPGGGGMFMFITPKK